MLCLNVTGTASLDVGPAHTALPSSTRNGCGRLKAPLVRCPGSLVVSVASPAVEVTVAVVDAVYSRSTPGVNTPNEAGAPSVSAKVAGTEPPTVPSVWVAYSRASVYPAGTYFAAGALTVSPPRSVPGASTSGSRSCRSLTPTDCWPVGVRRYCESCASNSSLSTWPGWTFQACGCSWNTCSVGPAPTPSGRTTPRAISRCVAPSTSYKRAATMSLAPLTSSLAITVGEPASVYACVAGAVL